MVVLGLVFGWLARVNRPEQRNINTNPSNLLECAQSFDFAISSAEKWREETQFSPKSAIYPVIKNGVEAGKCSGKLELSFHNGGDGTEISRKEVAFSKNAPAGTALIGGNYNEGKNIAAGVYYFRAYYGGEQIKTINIIVK